MTLYMLDTDIVSYLIRGRHPELDSRVAGMRPRQLCISMVTRGELLMGVHLKDGATQLARVVDDFLQQIQSLPWDAGAVSRFARIAASLRRSGKPIGSMDAMIAGHAASLGAVLVTNNTNQFGRIEGLSVENWA